MSAKAAKILNDFVSDLRTLWAANIETSERMELAKPLMERLVSNATLQAASRTWPSTEGRRNLLLHRDTEFGFVTNAVVRRPNRRGNAHDHSQAWVLYGLLDGEEYLERYDRLYDGQEPGRATIELASVTQGRPGSVDIVPPFSIHAEQGGPSRSVAIILRSERLVGRHLQNGYDQASGTVIARSGPEQASFDVISGMPV